MAAYEKAPLKFCIAGTGAMGLEHIRNICLLKDRGCTIVAVSYTHLTLPTILLV